MTTDPVVVGVDGSPAALLAVHLAVREARLRNLPLLIVFARSTDAPPPAADARRAVDEALAMAGAAVPAEAAILDGRPAAVLVHESRRAALLIVGPGRRMDLRLPGLGSVARELATHAACPVLVARGEPDHARDVLVGVDGSPAGDPAVSFGFEEAALRGTGLVALHAWTGPVSTDPGDMLPLVYDPAVVAAGEARILAEALVGWQAKYPDVSVHQRLVRRPAGRALVQASQAAGLAVVGRHGHRAWPDWLVGSVTHALLHQAHCPVAVVGPG